MSSQIQILRGSNANIVQNTSARLNAGQPLYNTTKNYLTIGETNNQRTTVRPVITPEVIGYVGDGASASSTTYITSSTDVEYSLNKISNTVRLYSNSLPINLMVNGTTTAELSVTDGLVTIPTASISTTEIDTAQVSRITGPSSSFNVFNSNMSISRTNSAELAEDEWEQLNITSDDRLRLFGQNEVTLYGANSIISGTTTVNISSPSTTIGALQVTRNGAYAMDIFNDGDLRIATGNNATISAGMDVNIGYSGTANLHSSYTIPSGGGMSSTTINATTSPTTSSILLNSAFGASNAARIQLTTGSSQSDIGIIANNISMEGMVTVNGDQVATVANRVRKYQHNITLFNSNIGLDNYLVCFSFINEEESAYSASSSARLIDFINAVVEISSDVDTSIPATGRWQNDDSNVMIIVCSVRGRLYNTSGGVNHYSLHFQGVSLSTSGQTHELHSAETDLYDTDTVPSFVDRVVPLAYI